MTEPSNTGLEVDIGVSLNKLTRQLAQAEARMTKAAVKSEKAWLRANPGIEKSFRQIDRAAAGAGRNGLRQVSLQLNQVAQQGAVTGDYLRALSIQMPDLLLAFGAWGALAGAAAGALVPFAAGLIRTSEAADKFVDSIKGGESGLSSVRSSISQLRDLQNQYTRAIEASATASGGAASAIAANSKKEFDARRQVLQVELDLLRLRRQEQVREISSLRTTQEAAIRREVNANTSSATGSNRLDPSLRPYVYGGPRTIDEAIPGLSDATNARRLEIQKLNAELELTEIAAKEAGEALRTEFKSTEGGTINPLNLDNLDVPFGGSGGSGGGSGSGGGGSVPKITNDIKELNIQIQSLNISGERMKQTMGQAFADIVTGASNAEDALAGVLNAFASTAAQSAFNVGFGGLFPNADGNAFSRGKLTPFANGGVVNSPTVFPMAKGMGLMGEAGPEAILPLKRGKGGRLGVEAGGVGGEITLNVTLSDDLDARIDNRAQRVSVATTKAGLAAYDKAALPGRVSQVNKDPRRR